MIPEHQGDVGLDDSMDGALEDAELLAGRDVEAADHASAAKLGMCGCFSVAYYRPYFDVNTEGVKQRLLSTLTFYKPEPTFLTLVKDSPDAYGPFWTATTLIFVVAVTANLTSSAKPGYNYDFELVTSCMSLVYGYLALLPLGMWAACKYVLNAQVPLIDLVCLFGYSLFLFIPFVLLALVPFLSWPSLMAAMVSSTLFILRSVVPLISQSKEKAMSVVAVFVTCQAIFVLIMKFRFFS